MKSASVREVQHGLAAILKQVQKGARVAVTRRGEVVAFLVPAVPRKRPPGWPDSMARMRRLVGGRRVPGPPASRLIRELREERF